jgi:hypothetical protein
MQGNGLPRLVMVRGIACAVLGLRVYPALAGWGDPTVLERGFCARSLPSPICHQCIQLWQRLFADGFAFALAGVADNVVVLWHLAQDAKSEPAAFGQEENISVEPWRANSQLRCGSARAV